jgi:Sulfotransferase family
MPADRPVFIGGLDRSGKTPLRRILERSDELGFIRHADFWTELDGRFGDLADDGNLAACLAAIRHDARFSHLDLTLPGVRERIAGSDTSYPRLFGVVTAEAVRRAGRSRWGVQHALIETRTPELLAAFADARILHLIRDPRDRYAALAQEGYGGARRLGVSVARWQASARMARANAAAFPAAYRVIRYEDLVMRAAATIGEIGTLIEEPAITPLAEEAQRWASTKRATVGIGERLAPAERRFIEVRLQEPMEWFGYDSEAPSLTWAEHLRYQAALRPAATLGAWWWDERDLRNGARSPADQRLRLGGGGGGR